MRLRAFAHMTRAAFVSMLGRLGIIHAIDDYLVNEKIKLCKVLSQASDVSFGRYAVVSNWSKTPPASQ